MSHHIAGPASIAIDHSGRIPLWSQLQLPSPITAFGRRQFMKRQLLPLIAGGSVQLLKE